jgi:four helix bundle protein
MSDKLLNQPSQSFTELIVWQKAHQLVLEVYRVSELFPKTEVYGLTSQLRRAAVSIPANIAEGYKRYGNPDKVRFLNIAQGSLEECRYYLILVRDLAYGDVVRLEMLLEEVSKLLHAYSATIRRRVQGKTVAALISFYCFLTPVSYLLLQ